MSKTIKQMYQDAFGRDWKKALQTDAQTLALTGCMVSKRCLRGSPPSLCGLCNIALTIMLLALGE